MLNVKVKCDAVSEQLTAREAASNISLLTIYF
jgi:hypothetical protein